MALLTRDAILSAPDLLEEVVNVPEWGGSVKIIGLTASQRDMFEDSILSQKGKEFKVHLTNARAKLASLCIVDEKNKRLFSENDIVALGAKSAKALDRVYGVAQRLSGISDDDIEELEKNSGNPQADDSSSD